MNRLKRARGFAVEEGKLRKKHRFSFPIQEIKGKKQKIPFLQEENKKNNVFSFRAAKGNVGKNTEIVLFSLGKF